MGCVNSEHVPNSSKSNNPSIKSKRSIAILQILLSDIFVMNPLQHKIVKFKNVILGKAHPNLRIELSL